MSESHLLCRHCGGTGLPPGSSEAGELTSCRSCGALILISPRGTEIRVEGADADDVQRVAAQLASEHGDAARRADAQIKGPWATGSFYLATLVILVGLLLVTARVVPIWAFPVIVVGALLGLVVVGAFQLRQDERLKEEGFRDLMGLALARLPLLLGRKPRDA